MSSTWLRISLPLAFSVVVGGCFGAPGTSQYTGGGVTFRHPDEMQVEEIDRDSDPPALVVRSGRALAVIGLAPKRTDLSKLREQTYERVHHGLLGDAQRSGTPISRYLAGHHVEGILVVGDEGSTTMHAEIYAVNVPGKSVSVVFVYPKSEAEESLAMLEVIGRSLERDAGAARRPEHPTLFRLYGYRY